MDVSPRQNPAYRLSLPSFIPMRRRIWCALLALYAGAIFALSQLPITVSEPPFPHFDKYFHAAEFALFLALAWKATNRRVLLSFALTAVYAGSDELHQCFVAMRTASAVDLAADLLGAAIALLVLEFRQRLWPFVRHRILGRIHSKVEW
jgi:VanZ family protein